MLHFLLVIFLWTLVSKFEYIIISFVLNRVPIFSLMPRQNAIWKSIIIDWKHSKYSGNITGTVVESVSQEKAVDTYLQLQKRRDKWNRTTSVKIVMLLPNMITVLFHCI